MTLLSGTQIVARPTGCWRLLARLPLPGACSLAALGAIGLFISTLTEQPIGATIAVLLFNVAMLHPRLDPASWPGCTRAC